MYTKEYVNENKIAIRCGSPEEMLEVLKLMTSFKKVHFGTKRGKELTVSNIGFNAGAIVARFFPNGNDFSICQTNGDYWKSNGYEEITGEQFLYANNVLGNYEIY